MFAMGPVHRNKMRSLRDDVISVNVKEARKVVEK